MVEQMRRKRGRKGRIGYVGIENLNTQAFALTGPAPVRRSYVMALMTQSWEESARKWEHTLQARRCVKPWGEETSILKEKLEKQMKANGASRRERRKETRNQPGQEIPRSFRHGSDRLSVPGNLVITTCRAMHPPCSRELVWGFQGVFHVGCLTLPSVRACRGAGLPSQAFGESS